jgi:acyl transferase domain-containing protein/acyl carrier protein
MIPSHFISIEAIPVTSRGKVDLKALRQLEAPAPDTGTADAYTGLRHQIEEKIKTIWVEILETEKIGMNDNFFDMGGNSLDMLKLCSRLKEVLEIQIPVATLFRYPTIGSLALHLKEGKQEARVTSPWLEPMEQGAGETGFDIAVIGLSGRFPGARNIEEFWDNLKNGVESISFLTDEDLKEAGVTGALLQNPDYVRGVGAMADKDTFDADFFAYIPGEAALMDPQIRVFHEVTWEALENAGYNPDNYHGTIGVYAGAAQNFQWNLRAMLSETGRSMGYFELSTLINKDALPTRTAYKLNLKGPAVSIQTACSSSLTAIHIACNALITRECHMAAAGGISLTSEKNTGHIYQDGLVISPDGHCRAFDARARGTITGQGIGVVILKRLKDARTDGDSIYALVKGSAANNDGTLRAGYTAPGVEGQNQVIKKALHLARVNPETITYVETHGTATPLGDPIEIKALTLAFNTNKKNYCAIGSVKTNIGHLDSAAGAASFIKTVMCLKHKMIPPSLHFESPNPSIDFANSPFYVNTRLKKWETNDHPLRAGVSSFGIGGTNVHITLEEFLETGETTSPSREYQMILFSGKTPLAREQAGKNLQHYFNKNPDVNLADAAFTLGVGRKPFQHRAMLVASSSKQAAGILLHGDFPTHELRVEQPRVVFMFPGQGSQYVNMGLELYQKEPVFRLEMDRCFDILNSLLDYQIKEILYPHPDRRGGSPDPPKDFAGPPGQGNHPDHIHQTEVTQPVILAFEYSLARLLMHWGIAPDALVGYSFGEYAAACLAGVFSLQDALELVVLRGQLMQHMPTGAMLSVPLPEEELRPLLPQGLSIAVVNEPACIVAGPTETINQFEKQMKLRRLMCMRINATFSAHSNLVNSARETVELHLQKIQLNKPQIPIVSGITGQWLTPEDAVDYRYWGRHLRETCRFSKGIMYLVKDKPNVFIEIGPGRDLTALTRRYIENNPQHQVVNTMQTSRGEMPDLYYLLRKIGQLWLYGITPGWQSFYTGEKRKRIALPTYPFQGRKFQVESNLEELAAGYLGELSRHEKKPDIADWFYISKWEQDTRPVPAAGDGPLESPTSQQWLLFQDECGLGTPIGHLLEQQGHSVVNVKAGAGFSQPGKREFTINPDRTEDYLRLFAALIQLEKVPTRILHSWSVTGTIPGSAPRKESLEDSLNRGFYSLLNIVRAAGDQSLNHEMQIHVLTNHMANVMGDEQLSPEKAIILGAVKTIPLEYPNIACRCIDVVLTGLTGEGNLPGQFLDSLMEELYSPAATPISIQALRGNHFWSQTYQPVKLEEQGPPHLLKEKGVYLITGGLGGIGFALAQYLASNFQASLILIGRSPFPAQDKWDQWLTLHEQDHPTSCKIRELRQMEKSGTRLMILCADVADFRQMKKVIHEAEENLGPINGVFHTAGVPDNAGVIHKRSKQDTEAVLNPKVKGTLVIEEVFKDKPLDLMVLFSSLGSIAPLFGQVGYTAANCFLDTYAWSKSAQTLRGRGRLTISINWDAWQEVGMGVKAVKAAGHDPGEAIPFGILPHEGTAVCKRIIGYRLPQVLVATRELDLILKPVQQLKEEIEKDSQQVHPSGMNKRPALITPYTVPATDTEQVLARIWEDFFGIEKIGARDDFFELGGDSLKAINVITRIQRQLHVQIPLPEFFKISNIAALASYIESLSGKKSHTLEKARQKQYDTISPAPGLAAYHQGAVQSTFTIEPAEKRTYYPLSSLQKRLFLLHQITDVGTAYHISRVLKVEGALSKNDLEKTFQLLIQHHESLRTSFKIIHQDVVQEVHPAANIDFSVQYLEISEESRSNNEIHQAVQNFIRPFDLKQAPLLRVGLIKLSREKHLLLFDIHHIISDGTSLGILVGDMLSLFQGKKLSPLPLQYKDFALWQNRPAGKRMITQLEAYWLERFKGEPPRLSIYTDYPRPDIQDFAGDSINFLLERDVKNRVQQLKQESGTTLYMILLTVFTILLSKYSGQEDIVVGTPIAGREHTDFENIIGLFINALPMRNFPSANKTFLQFLQDVKENTLRDFQNQQYPFGRLLEKLGLLTDISRNPLFDVELTLQNMEVPELQIEGLRFIPYQSSLPQRSQVDITFNVIETDEAIHGNVLYCTALFTRETIQRFIVSFKEILFTVLEKKEIQLKDIHIVHDFQKVKSTSYEEKSMDFNF